MSYACRIGLLSASGSLVRLKALLHGDPEPFVIYFTFGNLCAIASCFFLSGPKSHCKKMIDPTRRIATAFYLITIFFTFFVVFYEKIPDDGRVGIIILCVFVQWAANQISTRLRANRRGLAPSMRLIDGVEVDEASTALGLMSTRGGSCSGTISFIPSRGTGCALQAARRRATSARSTVLYKCLTIWLFSCRRRAAAFFIPLARPQGVVQEFEELVRFGREFGMSRREHTTAAALYEIRDRRNIQSTQFGPRLDGRSDGRAPQLREGDAPPAPARPGRSAQTHQASVDK